LGQKSQRSSADFVMNQNPFHAILNGPRERSASAITSCCRCITGLVDYCAGTIRRVDSFA
jgi:hypothetical protein